jgi:GNAT superfamily N-acetyltransferase
VRVNQLFDDSLNEIILLPQELYKGDWLGKLDYKKYLDDRIPFPGSDNLLLSFQNRLNDIYVVDPKGRRVAAKMSLEAVNFPSKNAKTVAGIVVDPAYRGQGIAAVLYQVVLRSLKLVLVADDVQTSGGAANWVRLSRIPGVEVMGYIAINLRSLNTKTPREIGNLLAQDLMEIGGFHIGTSRGTDFFAFPVRSGFERMETVVKDTIIEPYGYDDVSYEISMFAHWVGKR